MRTVTFTTRGALKKSALRHANERVIVNAVRQNPGISRADLARITGLAASSISFIVNRLTRAGIVTETPVENHSHVGRKPTALRLGNDVRLAVAVDVAQAGSRVALVNLEGTIVRQKAIDWHINYEIVAERLSRAIRLLVEKHRDVLGVGVTIPGTLDRATGRVVAAENLKWFDVDIATRMRGGLALPFYFENDARASALAVKWFTVPPTPVPNDFIFLTLTGGLGAGIVARGHLLEGMTGVAGEFGHTLHVRDGLPCECGGRGCLEQYASDKALPRLFARYGDGVGVPGATEIVELATRGDPAAISAIEQAASELAVGLANLVWLLNPAAIILGGYIASVWSLAEPVLWRVLRSRLPQYALAGLRLLPSTHGLDSPLLGAASLVFAHYFTTFEHTEDRGSGNRVLMSSAG
jgi:predicted NBD/HSP70 family sugar kinase